MKPLLFWFTDVKGAIKSFLRKVRPTVFRCRKGPYYKTVCILGNRFLILEKEGS